MIKYNAETIPDLLGPEGPLAHYLNLHEDRPYQREMTLEVARVLEDGGCLAVEAPTGIGKSLGYGLPAAMWALAGNRPVVVSTYTKALQRQLLETEAPLLAKVCGAPVQVRVLKGRSNYLCRRRYEAALQEAAGGTKELLERLNPWVDSTETGDFSQCGERGSQDLRYLALRVSSDARFCSHRECLPGSGCFYKKAKTEAQEADVLVVNHALLAVQLFDGGALPAFDSLIIDEAHAFVPQALDHLGRRVGVHSLGRLKDLSPVENKPVLFREGEGDSRSRAVEQSLATCVRIARDVFRLPNKTIDVDDRRRFRSESELKELCPNSFEPLLHELGVLGADCASLYSYVMESGDADGAQTRTVVDRFQDEAREIRSHLESILQPDDRDRVYWRQGESDGTFSLCESPIHLRNHLKAALDRGPGRVVFTSATLAAGKDFKHFSREVGLGDRLHTTALPSPFDYPNAVLALGLTQGPDPRHPSWALKTAESVHGLMQRAERNTLVLFTSYRDLQAVRTCLDQLRGVNGYHVVSQTQGRSAASVLDSFCRRSPAVLLGTATFWQGIDLPGDSLEVLVLARLPFSVPTDPRFQARSELLEAEGGNSFTQLYVPEAVLRFKQGFGRLIRRTSDRGIVAVLDPRLFTKGYGRRFREALPLVVEPVPDGVALVDRAAAWWNGRELEKVKT